MQCGEADIHAEFDFIVEITQRSEEVQISSVPFRARKFNRLGAWIMGTISSINLSA
jgi:hypothetical protein